MRHGVKEHKLGRDASHRKATMQALSTALIKAKRITTTLPKAKALRQHIEPIINRAKDDTMHNRREVFRYLQDKDAVKELFGEIAGKVSDREGGYTRVVRLGMRKGDGADVAIIELVDYNDVKPDGAAKKKTRRSRRRSGSTKAAGETTEASAE